MEELQLYFSVLTVLILLVILVVIWSRPSVVNERREPLTRDEAVGDLILVSEKGQPCAISREQFTGRLAKIRTNLMHVVGSVTSQACREAVSKELPQLKRELARFSQNQSDVQMCAAIQDALSNKSDDYLAARTQLRNRIQQTIANSRSDMPSSSEFAKEVDELMELLEATIKVIASKLCTPQGRLNLDYVNSVLDTMAKNVCDFSELQRESIDYALKTTLSPWGISQKDEDNIRYTKSVLAKPNPMRMTLYETAPEVPAPADTSKIASIRIPVAAAVAPVSPMKLTTVHQN